MDDQTASFLSKQISCLEYRFAEECSSIDRKIDQFYASHKASIKEENGERKYRQNQLDAALKDIYDQITEQNLHINTIDSNLKHLEQDFRAHDKDSREVRENVEKNTILRKATLWFYIPVQTIAVGVIIAIITRKLGG